MQPSKNFANTSDWVTKNYELEYGVCRMRSMGIHKEFNILSNVKMQMKFSHLPEVSTTISNETKLIGCFVNHQSFSRACPSWKVNTKFVEVMLPAGKIVNLIGRDNKVTVHIKSLLQICGWNGQNYHIIAIKLTSHNLIM